MRKGAMPISNNLNFLPLNSEIVVAKPQDAGDPHGSTLRP